MCIPKGVAPGKIEVVLKLMSFMLQPEQQAGTYDRGLLLPRARSPPCRSPRRLRKASSVIREFGRPQYDKWIAERPAETPLTPDRLVAAFRRWDEQIGSKRSK